jgi:hypothetical protein
MCVEKFPDVTLDTGALLLTPFLWVSEAISSPPNTELAMISEHKTDARACPECGGSGEGPDELECGNECVQKPCRVCKGSGLAILDEQSSYPYKLDNA